VSFAGTDAIARLLGDEDEKTVRLVRDQLASLGDDAVPRLRLLVATGGSRVSSVAQDILEEITRREHLLDFELLCRFFPEHGDLETACWSMARALRPTANCARLQHQLNSWGRRFLIRISGAISSRERVKLLAELMSGELEFRGNSDDYYNVRNCIFSEAMETRSGIPITLTALAMFIASRAGMRVCGINLPGHFIASHGDVFFDPFHRGRIMTLSDCKDILRCQNIEPQPCHFQPATPRQILRRMLANLYYIYDLQGECQRRQLIGGWMAGLIHNT